MKFKTYLLLLTLSIVSSCGYRFESLSPPLPEQANTIAVAPIINDTFRASLETRIYRYLQLALQNNDSVVIAPEKEADLVLFIHLKTLETTQTTLSEVGQTTASEWSLTGSLRLDKGVQVLWEKEQFIVRNELSYDDSQFSQDVTTQSRGVDDIAKKFATRVYEEIFVNF